MTLNLKYAFTNENNTRFGNTNSIKLVKEFQEKFNEPCLRVPFVFGGVVGSVDSAIRYWTDTDNPNIHFLLIDYRCIEGMEELLEEGMINALCLATDRNNSRQPRNLKTKKHTRGVSSGISSSEIQK